MSDDNTESTTESATTEQSDVEESGSRTESDAGDSFKPITTQTDLENVLKGRLKRAETAAEKKHTARIKELETIAHAYEQEKLTEDQKKDARISELTAALAERDEVITGHERSRVVGDLADTLKLPRKLWDRVRGNTEEEIEADIKLLLEDVPAPQRPGGTVKVQPTGGQGEQEITAEQVLAQINPRYR